VERSFSKSVQPFTLEMLTTLPSLPEDILHTIKKDLDFASTIALRSSCRQIYLTFPDSLLFSKIVLPSTLTQQQFDKLFSYLLSTNKTQNIRKLTFDQSQITERAIISTLEHCKNLQNLYILSCKQVNFLPITNEMVKWHQDKSGNSPDLKELKKIMMTRCIGGKRHSLTIRKVIQDLIELQSNDDSISKPEPMKDSRFDFIPIRYSTNIMDQSLDGKFQLQSCQKETCEYCIISCANCKAKYKYWDEFWIRCGWCKERYFCGQCISKASKKGRPKSYSYQFFRIKLCQMFDLPCPFF